MTLRNAIGIDARWWSFSGYAGELGTNNCSGGDTDNSSVTGRVGDEDYTTQQWIYRTDNHCANNYYYLCIAKP